MCSDLFNSSSTLGVPEIACNVLFMTRTRQSRSAPRWRLLALTGLGVETGIGLWFVGSALRSELASEATSSSAGWAVVAYLGLVVAALALVLRGVYRGRPWARAAGLTTQLLIVLAVGVPLFTSGRPLVGVLVVAPAVAVTAAVMGAVPARTHGPWSASDPADDRDPADDPVRRKPPSVPH